MASVPSNDRPLLGVALRICSASLFAFMSALIKIASTRGTTMPEIIFYRNALALPVVAAWIALGPGWGAIRTQRPMAHLTRGAIGLTSMLLTFGALALLPLSEATTLSYAAPIVATILSAMVLREQTGWHRWLAVLVGFAGVVIVIRPGHAHGLPPFGVAVGVGSALVLGAVMITLRQIGRTEHVAAIVWWFTLLGTLLGAAMLPFFGRHHDATTYGLLILAGLLGGGSQLTMTASLRFAPVATVVPFDYIQILWATLFGWLIFGSAPLASTLLGAVLIAGSGIYTAYRERLRGQVPTQVVAPPGKRRLMRIAGACADFALGMRWGTMPAAVQRETIRFFVNWVGCAIGGARTASAETAIAGLLAMSGPGSTPVLGRAERLQPADAALANCLTSAADTFDDTHLSTITHPTGPVAGAILAIADTRPVRGESFLAALSAGIEIECRISAAITAQGSGAHQGLYITGISGGVGAALATAMLLGASKEQTSTAIGLAAGQAAGLRATHGSMAIASPPAFAARNGLVAAHLAMAGFACADAMIEGKNGLLAVLAPSADAQSIVEGLGKRFELLGNACKPYPCGIVIHAAIDACLEIARHIPSADRIAEVRLTVHADALALCWRKLPATALEAQVSLFHWAAAALVRRQATLDEAGQTAVDDTGIRQLQTVMTAEADPQLGPGQARAVVRLADGRIVASNVEHASGSLERPMSDAALSAKFHALAGTRFDMGAVTNLLRSCWDISTTDDVGSLARSATLPG